MKFDEIDEEIIRLLTVDARTSNREVARLLNVSEGTVRNRLKRLEKAGAARIAAIVHPAAVGLALSAFVRIATTPSASRAVALAAAKLEHVSFVALTTGRYNVVTLVVASGREELAEIVHTHMRQWKGVRAIETLEMIRAIKHRLDVVRIQPPDRAPREEIELS